MRVVSYPVVILRWAQLIRKTVAPPGSKKVTYQWSRGFPVSGNWRLFFQVENLGTTHILYTALG